MTLLPTTLFGAIITEVAGVSLAVTVDLSNIVHVLTAASIIGGAIIYAVRFIWKAADDKRRMIDHVEQLQTEFARIIERQQAFHERQDRHSNRLLSVEEGMRTHHGDVIAHDEEVEVNE